jgi:hypothetical protein
MIIYSSRESLPACHLGIFTRLENAELGAVVFSDTVEDYRTSWHIDSHGESLRREENFDKIAREKDLNHFFQDGQ